MLVRMSLLSLSLFALGLLADAGSAADKAKPSPAEKQRRVEIDKLIEQLSAEDFKLREEATRQLLKRDDALPALRQAAKSDDAEVQRRARKAIESINKRLGKRAIARALAKLKKGQTDQFVDQVMGWREYMDEEGWKAVLKHGQDIADEASKVSQVKMKVPPIDLAKLRDVAADDVKSQGGQSIHGKRIIAGKVACNVQIVGSVILCVDSVESKRGFISRSVVFANGDVNVGDSENLAVIKDSIVVCDGNVTATASVNQSIILARGNVSVGASVENSVIVSGGEVKVGVDFPGAGIKNSLIQGGQRHPLNFISFFDPAEMGVAVKSSQNKVRIEEVSAEKPFDRAGVHEGDRVVAVDGVKVDSAESFRRLLRRGMQGSNPIILDLCRVDKPLRIEVRVHEDAR
jgi:hypothetical protein